MSGIRLNRGHTFEMHLKHFHHKTAKYNSDIQQSWQHLTCMKTVICQLFFCPGLYDPKAGSSRILFLEFMNHAVQVLRAALTPLQQELAAAGRAFGWLPQACREGKSRKGGKRSCWTQKAANINNVAFAVTYYFLSLPIFSGPLTSCLPTHHQRKNKSKLEGRQRKAAIMPVSCRIAGRNPSESCSQGFPCLCKCERPSGLPLFFLGFFFLLFILG